MKMTLNALKTIMAEHKPKKPKIAKKKTAKKISASVKPRVGKFLGKMFGKLFKRSETSPSTLKKFQVNPIIEPEPHLYWQSKATFNPSAIYGGGKIHLIYRAIGAGDVSVLGHAESSDGFTIDRKSAYPAYFQRAPAPDKNKTLPITYGSGGGWNGGAEDPRLTKIGNTVYMIYTSFDGWGSIRLALTSISFEDFMAERWHWKKPVFISPPGEVHKNWVLFPEKIHGKYAILHAVSPRILIDYIDDMNEFDGTRFIHSVPPHGAGMKDSWDNWIRGAGPAPLKTKDGWLVLYHAMDVKDPNRYKLGAMLLDLRNPTKILARSDQPILEPEEKYENEGHKWGVIYACGAVIVDGWLFVYYGGADKVSCVAAAELEPFLKELISSTKPKLKSNRGRPRSVKTS